MTSLSNSRSSGRAWIAVAAMVAVAIVVWPSMGATQEPPEVEASDAYLTAKGRVTFRVYCANCHGAKGKGDGTLAEILKQRPTDLTQLSKNNDGVFPREEIHQVIDGRSNVQSHGAREMPIWGEAFQNVLQPTWKEISDEERAQLKIVEVVYYLESIQETDEP